MKTVKLYKITCTKAFVASAELGSGFSLTPWGNDTEYYEGYDDGGKDYILPDGYEVAKSNGGTMEIYKGDVCCSIKSHSCRRPQLVSDSYTMPVLDCVTK